MHNNDYTIANGTDLNFSRVINMSCSNGHDHSGMVMEHSSDGYIRVMMHNGNHQLILNESPSVPGLFVGNVFDVTVSAVYNGPKDWFLEKNRQAQSMGSARRSRSGLPQNV